MRDPRQVGVEAKQPNLGRPEVCPSPAHPEPQEGHRLRANDGCLNIVGPLEGHAEA